MRCPVQLILLISLISFGLAMPAMAASPDTVVFVSAKIEDFDADYYLWAAEMAAARLPATKAEVVEGGLAGGLRYSRENPGMVKGIVEVVIDVHRMFEEVHVVCYDAKGRRLWRKKTELNGGGSEEKMARNMLNRVLKKAAKRPSCGG